MSNLKQIGLGFMQYVQDYDETFPPGSINSYVSVDANNPYGWADALQPYLKSTQIFQCPSEPISPTAATGSRNAQYTDYWFNSILREVKQASVTVVSLTVLSGDGGGRAITGAPYNGTAIYLYNGCNVNRNSGAFPDACGTDDSTATSPTATNAINNMTPSDALGRHLGGANYLFVDGHAKWFKGNGDPISSSSAVWNYQVPHAIAGGKPTFSYK